jgi:hypothetical protein
MCLPVRVSSLGFLSRTVSDRISPLESIGVPREVACFASVSYLWLYGPVTGVFRPSRVLVPTELQSTDKFCDHNAYEVNYFRKSELKTKTSELRPVPGLRWATGVRIPAAWCQNYDDVVSKMVCHH